MACLASALKPHLGSVAPDDILHTLGLLIVVAQGWFHTTVCALLLERLRRGQIVISAHSHSLSCGEGLLVAVEVWHPSLWLRLSV